MKSTASWPEILPVGHLAAPSTHPVVGERLDWLQFEVTEDDANAASQPSSDDVTDRVEAMDDGSVELLPEPTLGAAPARPDPGSSSAHRFIRHLGRGAMGVVALVHHRDLQRDVAVKLAHGGEDARRRLVREARALAALRHPNIVTVHEIGTNDRAAWVTMEYVPGPSLWSVVQQQGRLPVERAIDILEQLASALGHAHVHGLVHRDVKPGNIVLSTHTSGGDRPVLLDFGIVKATGDVGQDWTELTRDGAVIGTLAYMAPEQLDAQPVGPPADVFALGVLLFTMVTGLRPDVVAGGPRAAALLEEVPELQGADEDPRLEALQGLIGDLMARDPEDRPGNGCEAAARIASYRDTWLRPPDAPERRDSGRMPFLLGLVASVGLMLPVLGLAVAVPMLLWLGS